MANKFSRYENLEQLKKAYPNSWKFRDPESGMIDSRRMNPLSRDESTWSEADRNFVEESVKADATKILETKKHARYNQMLVSEINRRSQPSVPTQVYDQAALNRIFGDNDTEES